MDSTRIRNPGHTKEFRKLLTLWAVNASADRARIFQNHPGGQLLFSDFSANYVNICITINIDPNLLSETVLIVYHVCIKIEEL